jgi:hypothetical protein
MECGSSAYAPVPHRRLSLSGGNFLGASTGLAVQATITVHDGASDILLILLVALKVMVPCRPGASIVERDVLAREIMSLASSTDVVSASLRKSSCAGRELGRDNSIRCNPVGESILAVLNNSLAGLVSVISLASLAGSDWGIVDELEEVLSVSGDDGDLLTVLAQSIKLVCVGGLDLFASDVGQLGLSDERFGLGSHELLFEDDDLGRVGLLVLELGDLVRDLLLACSWRQ